jgi:hypothetical protein
LPLLQVQVKIVMNSLSLFAAISGIILLIMDILNIKISHFLKMESLNLIKTPMPYINIYNCEPANPSEKNSPSTQYCYNIQTVFLVSVKLNFSPGKKCGIFISSIYSGSRLSQSATYCLCVFGQKLHQ